MEKYLLQTTLSAGRVTVLLKSVNDQDPAPNLADVRIRGFKCGEKPSDIQVNVNEITIRLNNDGIQKTMTFKKGVEECAVRRILVQSDTDDVAAPATFYGVINYLNKQILILKHFQIAR